MAQVPDADVLTAAMHQNLPQRVRADRQHRRPATTPPAQNAALDQPGDLMPADAISLGLRQRPGDPQTRELGHPPLMHQTLTVVDGVVAGLHRSCRQPGWSSEHHAGKGEVSSHEACDLGAGDTEGKMRRSGTGGAHGLQPTVRAPPGARSPRTSSLIHRSILRCGSDGKPRRLKISDRSSDIARPLQAGRPRSAISARCRCPGASASRVATTLS